MEKQYIPAKREELKTIPTMIGVYIFEKNGKPIYIGKSVNLKARLISHFEAAKVDSKSSGYVNNADKISYYLTDSEFKALILESELIQKNHPKYNVRWMDDKSYLYVKATIKDEFPKFFITRREHDKNCIYFGPFPSVKIATNLLREIRKVFPFCTQKKITKIPCFYSKIKMCHPCPNVISQIEDPQERKQLTKEYKDNVKQVIKVLEGKVDTVVKQLYLKIDALTKKQQFEEAIWYRDRLYRLEGIVLRRKFDTEYVDTYNSSEKRVNSLQQLLSPYLPVKKLDRIECYDMSTFQFKESTASMVVFTNGLSDKKEYKRFKIKNEKAESDFEMIDEVIRRRLKNDWKMPDLFVIDGGKPQVRTVLKVLKEMEITIPLIGIAKRPDRIILGEGDLLSVRPKSDHPGFKLIQSLRDESHRFAKKYHIHLRNKKML
ncbi:MAG TPA: GIY-YIG nuclease family protein [Candidatus Woesebacteria bacterium]|nr:GIY-YIG nuclease family protein [Candidatus Woesebacteria bacterium]